MRHILGTSVASLLVLAGCALHPEGEREERERAGKEGERFEKPFEERALPPLARDAGFSDVLRYAFLANAELEQRYWEWRSAIERIPQEASPKTTAFVSYGYLFSSGEPTDWDRSTVTLGVDPMDNLPWPGKLSTAGRVALEEARAAGLRFERAKFDLQERVIVTWLDWALLAEQKRIRESDASVLEVVAASAEARAISGRGAQSDLLRARIAADRARNEVLRLHARLPGMRAELNALLSRPADAPLDPPAVFPDARPLAYTPEELLALAAERNPDLRALGSEVAGRREAVHLAELQRVPDFSGAGTIVGSATQMLTGAISLSFLRFEAIEAGIEQARAELRAAEAMRRQATSDVAARAAIDAPLISDVERQLALFRDSIEPRASLALETTRASYAAGQVPFSDLLDGQRVLLEVRMAVAELRVEREKAIARLESLAAVDASSPRDREGTRR